jgi:hypothetical protein
MNSMESTLSLPSRPGASRSRVVPGRYWRCWNESNTDRWKFACPTARSSASARRGRRSGALEVADWSMFERVLERGDVGFADAWIDGDWHSPDLAGLLTLLANNRQCLARAVYGQWWSLLTARLRHLAQCQHAHWLAPQHHGPLRSRQRLL